MQLAEQPASCSHSDDRVAPTPKLSAQPRLARLSIARTRKPDLAGMLASPVARDTTAAGLPIGTSRVKAKGKAVAGLSSAGHFLLSLPLVCLLQCQPACGDTAKVRHVLSTGLSRWTRHDLRSNPSQCRAGG